MTQLAFKKFNIVLLFLILTSCANINVVKIDQDLIRVDKFDNKNQFVKSYFKKFDRETSQWLPATCKNKNKNILYLKNDQCEFTDMSLHMISIAKESDNNFNSSTANSNKMKTVQEENNQDEQDNDNEESGFFMWCGGEDCNE